MDAPAPTEVWMVTARTGRAGVTGTLALEALGLVFREESGRFDPFEFPFADIRKVRRNPGSPVLLVFTEQGGRKPVMFWFTPPPNLETAAGGHFFRKHRAKRNSAGRLVQANERRREELKEWVVAVQRGLSR